MGIFTWIMDLFRGGEKAPVENETPEELTRREEREKARRDRGAERAAKYQAKKEYRIEKIHAAKEKIYAVATKRKCALCRLCCWIWYHTSYGYDLRRFGAN